MRTFSSRSPWQRAYAAASSRGRRRSRFRCPHTLPDTYQKDTAGETLGASLGPQFATKTSRPRRCVPAAPGAPVAARQHEVLARGDRLLTGRRSVTEEGALVRAHLEHAQVLPVLRVVRQPDSHQATSAAESQSGPKTSQMTARGESFASLRRSRSRIAFRRDAIVLVSCPRRRSARSRASAAVDRCAVEPRR